MIFAKHLHVLCAIISVIFFVVRGFWMLQQSKLLDRKVVKIAPHVIDTILLVSAIYLCFAIDQYPLANAWLTAKVFGLIAYIVLGSTALKYGKTMKTRIFALAGALLSVAYIFGVAKTHHAASWWLYL